MKLIPKIITTEVHAYIDYIFYITLICLPWILNISYQEKPALTLLSFGIFGLLYSACTNYELGMIKIIPMQTHLVIDAFIGILLIASPWLLGFNEKVWVPFVVFGAFAIIASMITFTGSQFDGLKNYNYN